MPHPKWWAMIVALLLGCTANQVWFCCYRKTDLNQSEQLNVWWVHVLLFWLGIQGQGQPTGSLSSVFVLHLDLKGKVYLSVAVTNGCSYWITQLLICMSYCTTRIQDSKSHWMMLLIYLSHWGLKLSDLEQTSVGCCEWYVSYVEKTEMMLITKETCDGTEIHRCAAQVTCI